MTIEEKARAYDEALKKIQPLYEQAKKDDNPIWSTYEYLVPELSESEDEKTRKRLIEFISDIKRISESGRRSWAVRKDDIEMCDAFLSYLKKQKENPKSADSISEDCTSDANSKDRWHKVTDSLPDNGQLVLAKDCLGNVLLARYDGENWEVNVYDNEDHYCHNSISKWCEIPSEKQKEQKSIGTDFRTAVKNLMNLHKIKNKFTEEDYDFHTKELLELVEQKPVEIEEIIRKAKSEGRQEVIDNPEYYQLQKPAEQVEINKSLTDAVIAELGKYNGENHFKSPWAIDSTGLQYPLHFANLGATWQKEQKPAEWSEEDEDIRDTIIHDLKRLGGDIANVKPAYKKEIDWLKSIRPKHPWKPSEEQIESVRYFVNKHQSEAWAATGQWKQFTALRGLLGDLLKLM